jgi:transcriptional regulator with XRE-family HTH domain
MELGDFVATRRTALRPADVGLTGGPRRRVPGLRRDEVARLAGLSPGYYARIEQGGEPRPSERALSGVARALRLSRDERDRLFRLADRTPPAGGHVEPGLLALLDRLTDIPARCWYGTLPPRRCSAPVPRTGSRPVTPVRSAWSTPPSGRWTWCAAAC